MFVVKCKNTVLARLAAVMLLIGGCLNSGFTQCTLADNAFLYKHQTFESGSWKVITDSIDAVIPQSLCDNKPYQYVTAGTFDSSVAVSIDSMGVASLTFARILPPAAICSKSQFVVDTPIVTVLTNLKDVPVALAANSSLDTVYLARKTGNAEFVVTKIGRTGNIIDSMTIQLSNPGSRVITSIHAESNGTAGFRVCGTNGLVRFVPFSSSGATGAEVVSDLAVADTVAFANSQYAVTQDGTVYKWVSETLTQDFQLSTPVKYAGNNLVCGTSKIAVLSQNGWAQYQAEVSDMIVAARVSYLSAGLTVENVKKNSNWVYNGLWVADSQTVIKSTLPALTSLNGIMSYSYTFGVLDSLFVITSDVDSNTQVPAIAIQGTSTNTSLFDGISYVMMNRGADQVCEIGNAVVNSDTFKIVLHPDSIIYESNYLLGTNNVRCNTVYWAKKKIRFGKPWNSLLSCRIDIGAESVIIIKTSTGTVGRKAVMQSGTKLVYDNKEIILNFSAQVHAGGLITICSISGRVLAQQRFNKSDKTVALPIQNPDQMILSRIEFDDGITIDNRHVPLR